jgi:hypothetical protein
MMNFHINFEVMTINLVSTTVAKCLLITLAVGSFGSAQLPIVRLHKAIFLVSATASERSRNEVYRSEAYRSEAYRSEAYRR